MRFRRYTWLWLLNDGLEEQSSGWAVWTAGHCTALGLRILVLGWRIRYVVSILQVASASQIQRQKERNWTAIRTRFVVLVVFVYFQVDLVVEVVRDTEYILVCQCADKINWAKKRVCDEYEANNTHDQTPFPIHPSTTYFIHILGTTKHQQSAGAVRRVCAYTVQVLQVAIQYIVQDDIRAVGFCGWIMPDLRIEKKTAGHKKCLE